MLAAAAAGKKSSPIVQDATQERTLEATEDKQLEPLAPPFFAAEGQKSPRVFERSIHVTVDDLSEIK